MIYIFISCLLIFFYKFILIVLINLIFDFLFFFISYFLGGNEKVFLTDLLGIIRLKKRFKKEGNSDFSVFKRNFRRDNIFRLHYIIELERELERERERRDDEELHVSCIWYIFV